jgi:hypothetical protein
MAGASAMLCQSQRQTFGRSSIDRRARLLSLRNFGKLPRRDGPNPRKAAESKFNALVKSGLDPLMLVDEVGKFGAAEAGRGNVGTRFIPQTVTWLNQQRGRITPRLLRLLALIRRSKPRCRCSSRLVDGRGMPGPGLG